MIMHQHLVTVVAFEQITASNYSSPTFSGSQGFLVLIAGVLLAFAFQLLLGNFFIALGISYSESEPAPDVEDLDTKIDKIGMVVGLRALGTLSITLFAACSLAVKLSFMHDRLLGAILGLIIWAAYLSLLIWVSSTTVSSVIGTLLKTATSGLQGIIGTAAVAIGAKNVSEQLVSTAETAAATIRQELSSAVDSVTTREAIDNYLKKLQLEKADREEIRAQFERLVAEPEMKSLARENHLRQMGRQTFVDLVNSRTEFSKQSINQVLDSWESFWQQAWNQPQPQVLNGGLLNGHKLVAPEELKPSQLTPKLEQLIETTRQQQAQQQAEAAQKVAETAAWWLFGTIFLSAIVSAIAGSLAAVY
ncbi:hypothetical protein Glo7428_1105 [Gloeocapsa sp. PCC 7428]|nr:hypothetical protein Glo7428_1105 [Gloeocapsa sp. PCC 7428]